jgi:type IV pilus assembly protein PilA
MNQLSIRKNNLQTKKKKKGFTLVELIIVIAIIAILAMIAIPKLGSIKGDANNKADIATAKSIATLVSKEIANDTISNNITDYTIISSIPAKLSGGTAINIESQLDGKTKSTAGNSFYIKITDGNVTVYDGNATSATALFPQTSTK